MQRRWSLINRTAGGSVQLSDLSDVTSATATAKFALMADGSAYVGRAIVEADISDLQAYITGYTVTEGDVTGHEAALTILESQITDANVLARVAGNEAITGVYTFTGVAPYIGFFENDATAEEGRWRITATGDALVFGAYNDAESAFANFISIDRTSFVVDTIAITGALSATGAVTGSNLNVANWDTAFGWGDHGVAGYITDYTVTEGDVTAHQAALSIAETQIPDGAIFPRLAGTEDITGIYTFKGAAPYIGFYETGATADEGRWRITANSDQLQFSTYNDAEGVFANFLLVSRTGATATTIAFTGALSASGAITGSNLNVANWDTAYGWGDHAGGGYLTSETSHADVVVDGDFASNGILKRTSAGVYGIVTDNSANWDTAFGWGDHASTYLPLTGGTLSAQLLMDNSIYISWKNSVGSPIALLNLWSDNIFYIGENATNMIIRGSTVTIDGGVVNGTLVGNWNTAYGWGDHASGGYAASSHNHAATDLTSGIIPIARIMTAPTTHAVQYASGANFDRLGGAEDFNDLKLAGIYSIYSNANTNAPTGHSYDVMWVGKNSSDIGAQFVVPRLADKSIAYRGWTGGTTFYPWQYCAWGLAAGQIEDALFLQSDLHVGGDTTGKFQAFSGGFGSVQCTGANGGFHGYSIGGRHVFMDNGGTTSGLYNDTNNQWMISFADGGSAYLYHAGNAKLQTASDGIDITGDVRINNNEHYRGKIVAGTVKRLIGVGNDDKLYINTDTIANVVANGAWAFSGAITAASYGGITEANLLDKNAAESIGADWNWGDNDIIRANLKDYSVQKHTETSSAGTLTIDMSLGSSVTHVMTENITTVSIINPPASGTYGEVLMKIHQHASSAKTITYASKYKFPAGANHVMTTTLGAIDMVHFSTINAGTEWQTTYAQDFK